MENAVAHIVVALISVWRGMIYSASAAAVFWWNKECTMFELKSCTIVAPGDRIRIPGRHEILQVKSIESVGNRVLLFTFENGYQVYMRMRSKVYIDRGAKE